MLLNYKYLYIIFLFSCLVSGQVGIGTTAPAGMLDVTSTTNGMLVPRVSLSARNIAAPVVNPQTGALVNGTLVWNTATAGVAPNNVTPGFYFWNGSSWSALAGTGSNNWSVTGNSGLAGGNTAAAGTNFIGTTDAQNIDFRTNNNFVGRFSALGEFFVGTLNTVIAGDLMNAVSNAAFPWAINGYSTQNGGGVYGSVQGGTTRFAAVQGEYNSTAAGTFNTAGVRGLNASTATGTGFRNLAATGPKMGVNGNTTSPTGTYTFGVHGSMNTGDIRSGAIFGDDFGIVFGGLGYYASTFIDYGVYGFGSAYQTGGFAGRFAAGADRKIYNGGLSELPQNSTIGLGIYGGVMGGWVRGLKYGFHTKGESYSLYVDGHGYTNEPIAYLAPSTVDDKRIPTYMQASIYPEISIRGNAQLSDGKTFVPFPDDFKSLIYNPENLIIIATPRGKCNALYVDTVTSNGFYIVENDGTSNAKLSWEVTVQSQSKNEVPAELLSSDFDRKMDRIMFNDNNLTDQPGNLWWDGSRIRWDKPPAKTQSEDVDFGTRPKEKK